MEFKIGDKITIVNYENLPEKWKNKGTAKLCGKNGTIIDCLYSQAENGYVYKVLIDGKDTASAIPFTENMFVKQESKIRAEVIVENGLAIVRLYDGDKLEKQAHAHIFKDGLSGVAQAVSYAAKRLYLSFEDNADWHYRRKKDGDYDEE